MRKDRFNICISFYAVLAFVLAILGQTLLCGMLLGFVIVIQKDEWLTKQVMQVLAGPNQFNTLSFLKNRLFL